ncbi:MAG: L-glutamate gamma-semialdehyde dehydrogenase [Bacteroidales bacterium]|nr:L-glutamate gamma-semialdehyde dehydrogenase [Bacteroidales bacterium]
MPATGFYNVPEPQNEHVLSYAPGTRERDELKQLLWDYRKNQTEIPMFIGGREIKTGRLVEINPPHDHGHILGYYHQGNEKEVSLAINAALKAREMWSSISWEERASIFLKAADLLSGPYRLKINAATMLGQSKNIFQAEIDAACELIDFLRYNVKFMTDLYKYQPYSPPGVWNRLELRPLEGFIFAVTPFNFTSIAGNLPTSPAIMGNVVVWKPSATQVYSARVIMDLLKEAGLPDGVINMVFAPGPVASNAILSHPDFSGLHYTGSTQVFQSLWKTIGRNIHQYHNYPRIVGETGGKDFVIVHESADPQQVVTAISRGAFEYQGQKCSAVSRAYIPDTLWPEIKNMLLEDIASFRMGGPEDFTNFINAVIDDGAFKRINGVIRRIKKEKIAKIIAGGRSYKGTGYFIEPTVAVSSDPFYFAMQEEFFGPVLTLYIYPADKYTETLELCDKTSIYALTGSVFARKREIIELTTRKLVHAAGNFYINDKPTGAVVGQQPFGGSRGSGTNDKAGSALNLIRWVSPRSIKETFVPPVNYRYPFMVER